MTPLSLEEVPSRLGELKSTLYEKYGAKEIQLFGSIARKQQNAESDIDILVEFEDDANLFDLTGLALFLEDELSQKVNVVSRRALREELRASILKEAISI